MMEKSPLAVWTFAVCRWPNLPILSALLHRITPVQLLIKENIRLGNPDATDEEVYAAAKAACCDEFIQKLDNGYDTMAGDAGNRLSGGEKQRISIARMILKNAPIVILDEATAFTDQENEEKIQQSIAALDKRETAAGHRTSSVHHQKCRSDYCPAKRAG